MAGAEPDLAGGVRAVLAEAGEDPGELELAPIPGGASRETWMVGKAAPGREAQEAALCVLRRDPKGSVSLVPMAEEYALAQRVAKVGVPVPEPIAFEPEGGRFGSPGMLMAFVEGISVAPRLLRKPEYEAARERLPGQLADALARVHSLGAEQLEGVLPAAAADPAVGQVSEWERQIDAIGEPLPAIELGLRWLRANAPDPAPVRLVHGDFRLGNFIVGTDGLGAVIDWELAHLGDPAEDIGWLCIRSWRFGNDDLTRRGPRGARRLPGRLRGGGRGPGGPGAGAVLGGVREREVGCDLRPAGRRPPKRHPAKPRARIARPPDLRAGVGHAGAGAGWGEVK